MSHILRSIYRLFFAPRQRDEDIRNREIVLNVLLAGTLLILSLAIVVIVGNYISGRTFVVPRAAALVLVFLLVLGIYRLSRRGQYTLSAWLLVTVYLLLATGVGLAWSISLPSAVLLYGLVVVLAGILLGPRYSLVSFGMVVIIITGTAMLGASGIVTPDLTWRSRGPGPDDVFGLSFMLGMIAAVSWLFNYQMGRSLKRAQRAEAALLKQKGLLETTVQQRTQELQTVQLEKIRQMYRFAELGQLSTALLHDLSNHLTTLTLDIEGLEGQTRSQALGRAKRSIKYIDNMVVRVRDQLHGKSDVRPFNIPDETNEVVKMLRHKAQANDVILRWNVPDDKKNLRVRGEPIRFRQLMANLISNAIDAYFEPRDAEEKRDVQIDVKQVQHNISITVNDWGRGIPEKDRAKLFEPFFSTKHTGMGMGLYIAKQIVEEHFLGEITLGEGPGRTSFTVTLPRVES